jgi:modulator of drug activity B
MTTKIKKGIKIDMRILLVNGYQKHDFSKGELNFSLYNLILNELRHNYSIKVSDVENYNVIDERNKFFWADIVIFQFPIYWFSVPGKLKLFMDEVFEYGQFYSFAEKYGSGGLMKGKSYVLSTTWNAPKDSFDNTEAFFEGSSVDDILLPIHKTMEFCGFTKRKTLSFHNVVKDPNFEQYKSELLQFLKNDL